MGRMRVFFCAFCLDRNADRANSDHSFNQDIDVSHLATPHISSNQSLTNKTSSNSTPVGDDSSESNIYHHYEQQAVPSSAIQNQNAMEHPDRREIADHNSLLSLHQQQDNNRTRASSSSTPVASSPDLYEMQPQDIHQEPHLNVPSVSHQQHQNQAMIGGGEANDQRINGTSATKLSYDIISVREPLAKILEERQLLQLAQQQQRQILGDHDYIEVYGERGSSCFYEEIAGSTTSSATYDQIGNPSNHSYQVLVNNYAVANIRSINGLNQDDNNGDRMDRGNNSSRNPNQHNNENYSNSNINHIEENLYNVTDPPDEVDGGVPNTSDAIPSTSLLLNSSSPLADLLQNKHDQPTSSQLPVSGDRDQNTSQSIPVYSVINKNTRRGKAIIRNIADNCRPPQPPPKNLTPMTHQPSTSAIQQQTYQDTQDSRAGRSPQVLNSTFGITGNSSPKSSNSELLNRLPQPPPRFSKHPMFNATNRPLPLPDSFDLSSNGDINTTNTTTSASIRNLARDEDIESVNNGYELLSPRFDDDQIDVGYEKIRESNRYSGGSLSSQFCPLQALDNGGYESVQPIYSSLSNALVEPNYEAIGPATGTELAAAATARLTAAAAYEQYLKQDQQ